MQGSLPLWKVLSGAIDQNQPLLTGAEEHSGETSGPGRSASQEALQKAYLLSRARL